MRRPTPLRSAWILCLWPGLPHLWRRGSWTALAVAVGFSLVFDLLLLSSVVWDEVASPASLRMAWSLLGGFWCGALVFSLRNWPSSVERPIPSSNAGLFPQALLQYLQGNWFEAERLCRQAVLRDPRDGDARLMLATVLRREGRLGEAAEHLDQLASLTAGRKWEQEIADERQRIAELATETTTEAAPVQMARAAA
ncbi:MAG TPA: tetratricopeptide repeat protein [Pirellulales bacterium]|nr:tetratricopeptide repeat protein [Pirellulales bacterium]